MAAAAGQEDRADELSWFGYFFALGRFDDDWSVETLQSVLRLGIRVEHPEIVERLIALDEHRLLIEEESGREIVRSALQSQTSNEAARAFVNSLGSEGQFQFADLLA